MGAVISLLRRLNAKGFFLEMNALFRVFFRLSHEALMKVLYVGVGRLVCFS